MKVEQLIPRKAIIDLESSLVWQRTFTLKPYDQQIIEFLNALSKGILTNRQISHVPAFTALGFWLRKSNIEAMIAANQVSPDTRVRLSPLGIVFHVCPSNVDTMFVYSLAISLIMGNKNILRISKRTENPVLTTLFEIVNEQLAKPEFKALKDYIVVVTYGHDEEINTFISGNADGRILWGGDHTINTFKRIQAQSRTKDIVFADRLSFAIFNAHAFNAQVETEKEACVKKFFNDSYTFDQKGCSSPQALIVMGEKDEKARFKTDFYTMLSKLADSQYESDDYSMSSLKLNAAVVDIAEHKIKSVVNTTANLYLAEATREAVVSTHSCGGGFFYMYDIDGMQEIKPLISKKVQTISYFGLTQAEKEMLADLSNGLGIDRIVPVGTALNFDNLWDGYNLMDELSLKKVII